MSGKDTNSAFRPLLLPLFRWLWIASMVSNIGTWMQEVGAAWLMTSLTTSPAMVALLETAMTLPIFLLSLPAGAVADIVDRRRILISTQSWMLAVALLMSILTLAGVIGTKSLLALTFVLNVGAAVNGPAWQAILPEIVPSVEIPAAVALGSIGFNVARAVGPALGGLIIAASGPWAVFLLNAVSFLGVIWVLHDWKREHRESILPAERIFSAVRAGLRYARHAPALHTVLIRTATFIVFASAMWAVLPYVARHEMGLTAAGYGTLVGVFGTGAVSGAWLMARMRRKMSMEAMVRLATVMFSGFLATLALTRVYPFILCGMYIGGIAWMIVMSSLNTAAQFVSPHWVRARVMAVYILVFMGGFACGSAFWGMLASYGGTMVSLLSASGCLLAGLAFGRPLRIDQAVDHTQSMHWADPVVVVEPHPEEGPVLVAVEYSITPGNNDGLFDALRALRGSRRRNGAIQWGIFRDLSNDTRLVEYFIVESWAEHMRQHERVTVADREIEKRVRAFHAGPGEPSVEHYIYAGGPPRPNGR